mmetsp:Transcript_74438/g.206722  ORF Transcript_74438/g.206722 Transcript_74438/m.206722 type:complete len:281 (+) Transcript_74438:237-1079(+)
MLWRRGPHYASLRRLWAAVRADNRRKRPRVRAATRVRLWRAHDASCNTHGAWNRVSTSDDRTRRPCNAMRDLPHWRTRSLCPCGRAETTQTADRTRRVTADVGCAEHHRCLRQWRTLAWSRQLRIVVRRWQSRVVACAGHGHIDRPRGSAIKFAAAPTIPIARAEANRRTEPNARGVDCAQTWGVRRGSFMVRRRSCLQTTTHCRRRGRSRSNGNRRTANRSAAEARRAAQTRRVKRQLGRCRIVCRRRKTQVVDRSPTNAQIEPRGAGARGETSDSHGQ